MALGLVLDIGFYCLATGVGPAKQVGEQITLNNWRQQVQGWCLTWGILLIWDHVDFLGKLLQCPLSAWGFRAAPRPDEDRVGYLGRPTARKKMLSVPWLAMGERSMVASRSSSDCGKCRDWAGTR